MIQRKQTLYLLIAILLLVFCLCNKIVSISTAAIGQDAVLYTNQPHAIVSIVSEIPFANALIRLKQPTRNRQIAGVVR